MFNDDEFEQNPSLPPREGLARGFAVRLADQRGISVRANFPPDQIYDEPNREDDTVAVEVDLPNSVKLIGMRRGYLIFDFSGSEKYCGGEMPSYTGTTEENKQYTEARALRDDLIAARARYINAFLSTLSWGRHRVGAGVGPQQCVHIGNYLSADIIDNNWHIYGAGASPPIGGWPQTIFYIPGDAFRNAGEAFVKIHTTLGDDDTFQLLALLQDCISHFHNHQFSAALVVGWSVAEALLNRRWRTYLNEVGGEAGRTKINKDRRDKLTGRDFTASIITETLSLAGKLNEATREELDSARKARNKFVHNVRDCDPAIAFQAASVAAKMIGEDAGFDFRISSSYPYQI